MDLIWPPRELHPNARIHFMAKAKITKQYREYARIMARQSGIELPAEGKIDVYITFLPPDKRRRDMDGCLNSVKAALDGIADGLKVNDYRFRLHLDMGEPVKGGCVRVEFEL